MKLLPAFALLSLLAAPSFADDAPAPSAATVTGSSPIVGAGAGNDASPGILVAPKIFVNGKEVEPNSKEGRALLEQVGAGIAGAKPSAILGGGKFAENPEIQKQIANLLKAAQPGIQEQIKKQITASRAKTHEALALSAEELAAVEPLLERVEQLRLQKSLLDGAQGPLGGENGQAGPFELNLQKAMLGDAPVEPPVRECQDARKALKALLDDKQANAAEVNTAMARIRKARAAFGAVLGKAQAELKAVLTPRQEALLMDRGILD